MAVLRLLRGLHGLADLHADDVDLRLAVLQHLLSRLEQLLVLRRGRREQEEFKQRAKEGDMTDMMWPARGPARGPDEYLGTAVGIDRNHVLCSLFDLQLDV